jgi:hypothetical protein
MSGYDAAIAGAVFAIAEHSKDPESPSQRDLVTSFGNLFFAAPEAKDVHCKNLAPAPDFY